MLSLRVGQTLVRLIRAYASAQQSKRYSSWLGLALVISLAAGAGVTLARLGNTSARSENTSERPGSPQSPASAPFVAHPSFAHFVTATSPLTLSDVSMQSVTSVPAASFEEVPVAPGSIVAAFGSPLATQRLTASDDDLTKPGVQLPKLLGGTWVEVNGQRAELFFVSQLQVNYVMPDTTASGVASIVIRSGDGTISNGTVQTAQASPAIFTANSDGGGVPAANLLRIKSGVLQPYETLSQFIPNPDPTKPGRFVTKPIDLGPEGEDVYLILYLTGVRRAAPGSVRVLINGDAREPLYSGPAPDFVGLDQINVLIPRDLPTRGNVNVSVTAGGSSSNLVEIELAGNNGVTPPQVSGFGGAQALAGKEMIINGSGFSADAAKNIVRIAGLVAEVKRATPTQLTVMVPFGVKEGPVRVTTPSGEGVSANILPVRTSISGVVENTARQPLANVIVLVRTPNGPISQPTNADGHFVLPDVPEGTHLFEANGKSLNVDPPYPLFTSKISVEARRDNAFPNPIPLQQATGSSGFVGSESSFGGGGSQGLRGVRRKFGPDPVTIEEVDPDDPSRTYILKIQGSTTAKFPDNSMSGEIFLTHLKDARTPVALPFGVFSSSIVQITQFGVELDPGAKLIFPNKDNIPAGAPVALFRYDQKEGKFVQDSAQVSVSADGKWIETEQGAIKTTTYYFAAVPRDTTTTITGRVFEENGRTPVARAVARVRGREAFTDGTGSYVLRYVA
ncbi:MAG: IPT/TIG domain-containing protein, partial [Blastocatellia bacterium]